KSAWFSDGYGDYIRHFMEGLAAVPEWAPAGEDHLLKSTSVVQTVSYKPRAISYKTFDNSSTEVLRLTRKPKSITVNGRPLRERRNLDTPGWTWKKLKKSGVLRISHEKGSKVVVEK
ncbi:MAG: hypothetical protein U9P14_07675, partial [Gemmatimonadota bacterium]|nr:hypothetical protein [Gemmatimonadota bacterium]